MCKWGEGSPLAGMSLSWLESPHYIDKIQICMICMRSIIIMHGHANPIPDMVILHTLRTVASNLLQKILMYQCQGLSGTLHPWPLRTEPLPMEPLLASNSPGSFHLRTCKSAPFPGVSTGNLHPQNLGFRILCSGASMARTPEKIIFDSDFDFS